VNSPLLDLLESLAAKLAAAHVSDADAIAVVRRVVNSPLVALTVRATPNPVDDTVLAILKAALTPK
jgi:ABC-type phosphonate transport system ATPase subunit